MSKEKEKNVMNENECLEQVPPKRLKKKRFCIFRPVRGFVNICEAMACSWE